MWRSVSSSVLKLTWFPQIPGESHECVSYFGNAGTARVPENIFTLTTWKRTPHLEENTKTLLLQVRAEDNQHRCRWELKSGLSGPTPDLVSQNLHFNNTSRWFPSTGKFGKYCTKKTLTKEATEISGDPQLHVNNEFQVHLALSWKGCLTTGSTIEE